MKKIQGTSNPMAALPSGAVIKSAKGHISPSGGSFMDVTYSIGNNHFHTTIKNGGQSA